MVLTQLGKHVFRIDYANAEDCEQSRSYRVHNGMMIPVSATLPDKIKMLFVDHCIEEYRGVDVTCISTAPGWRVAYLT